MSFITETKYIRASQLLPGQQCDGYKTEKSTCFCSFKISEVAEDGVHVLMWGKNPEILPLDALYEVPLTEKEFSEEINVIEPFLSSIYITLLFF